MSDERYWPSPGRRDNSYYEHRHRYLLAARFARGKQVLDLGCGEGYGSNLLADHADFVTGVDQDESIILHAKASYRKENLIFMTGDAGKLPFREEYFDLVVCFEVLEHLPDPERLVREAKPVLKRDGLLVLSTPIKGEYGQEHRNAFHIHEFAVEEFRNLIRKYFAFTRWYAQRFTPAGFLYDASQPCEPYYLCDEAANAPAMYQIALAGKAYLPEDLVPNTLFLDGDSDRENREAVQALHGLEQQVERAREGYEDQKRQLEQVRRVVEEQRRQLFQAGGVIDDQSHQLTQAGSLIDSQSAERARASSQYKATQKQLRRLRKQRWKGRR